MSGKENNIKLFIIGFIFLLFSAQPGFCMYDSPVVLGYYAWWLHNHLPAENIPYDNLTHIAHAFVWPDANGTVVNAQRLDYPELFSRAKNAGVKVILSVGGWGSSDHFAPVAADSSLRRTFIENLLELTVSRGYDGVDLDWEYPSSAAERTLLTGLCFDLRKAMDEIDESLLLTMAVPAGNWSGQWVDFEALKNVIDWFGCMTYDFFGSWVSRSGHNSPLFPPASNNQGSVQAGMNYLHLTRGVPKNQILIGIPFYGKRCAAAAYNAAYSGGVTDLHYSQIAPLINNNWDYHWDNISKVPYLLHQSENLFITFDDTASVRHKCEFALNQSVGGVMMWALGQDLINHEMPLLNTVGQTILLSTGVEKIIYDSALPDQFTVTSNYPNPFNFSTVIRFYLPERQNVKVECYNYLGQKILVSLDEQRSPGWHDVRIDLNNYATGIYFARVTADNISITRKITLIR